MKVKAFVSAATVAAFGFVLCMAAPAAAKGGGPKPKAASGKPAGGAPKGAPKVSGGPKGGTSVKGGAPKGGAPKGGATAKGGGAAKGATPKGSAAKGSSAQAPKGGKAPSSPNGSAGTDPAAGKHAQKRATTQVGADPNTVSFNKAQQQLMKNTNLREKIQSRLPAGMDVIDAASEFRNLGQFQAAVNASHNQGYDFLQLKALMTGPDALSLGQAKQRLRAGTTAPVPGPIPPDPTGGGNPIPTGGNQDPTGGGNPAPNPAPNPQDPTGANPAPNPQDPTGANRAPIPTNPTGATSSSKTKGRKSTH